MRRRTLRRVVVATWFLLLGAWVWHLRATGTSPLDSAQDLVDALDGAWWAVPAFIAVYAARPLLLFPASLLTVAAGVLFGPVLGIGVAVVAANLSAMVAYGVGRIVGPEALADADDDRFASRWSRRLREESFLTVMIMRLAFLPFDLVNYVSGYLRIHPGAFLVATALGSLPGTVAFVLAGASVERLDRGLAGFDLRVFAASVAIFVVSVAVSRVVQRREALA